MTRDVAVTSGAITYREIEAYNASTLACLRAWDVKLIRRIDIAVRVGGDGKPAKTDVGGLKAMLRGVVAQKAARDASAAS